MKNPHPQHTQNHVLSLWCPEQKRLTPNQIQARSTGLASLSRAVICQDTENLLHFTPENTTKQYKIYRKNRKFQPKTGTTH